MITIDIEAGVPRLHRMRCSAMYGNIEAMFAYRHRPDGGERSTNIRCEKVFMAEPFETAPPDHRRSDCCAVYGAWISVESGPG
ncbi:MAG: hypothetical protein ACRYGA_08180 [Janthinobacterium lividum]